MRADELTGWIESPSGQAKIFIRDGYFHEGKWRDGSVRLKPPGSPSFELRGFKRPNEAVINEAGFAAIADWLSFDKLESMLYFVRPNGIISQQHRFNVNLGRLAIDPKGVLVFVTTAASEFEEAKLLCYNIESGELLWSKVAPKPAAEITVVPGEEFILVGRPYKSCGSDYLLKIGFDGAVLERWPDSPYHAIDLGEMEREAGRVSQAERWFRIAAESDISAHFRARAYKALGELAEEAGRVMEALNLYEKALALDSKIGVKRKVEALRRATKK